MTEWQLPNLMTHFTQNVDGERVATLQSIEQYYNRRIIREKEEIIQLKNLIDQQFLVIERLNIKDSDLRHKTKKDPEKNLSDEYEQYTSEQTDKYSSVLKEENNFKEFLTHHPYASATLLDPAFNLDSNKTGETIQQFLTDKRNNFYTNLFVEINSASNYFNYYNNFLSSANYLDFSEKIGSELASIFKFKRAILFNYNKKASQISVNKQRLTMNYSLDKGLIKDAAETGKRYFIQKLSKNAGSDDFAILGRSDNIWVVPIPELSNVIILYDTEEVVTASKDLLISNIIEILKHTKSFVDIREQHLSYLADYQLMNDELIKLSSIGDMRSFLQLLTRNLESSFECEAVKLIRIRRNRNSMTKYGMSKEDNVITPLSTGLCSSSFLHQKTKIFENPELLSEFDRRVDRAERSIKSKSMMSVPVFTLDSSKRVKWLLVFYNKKRTNGFSEKDQFRAEIFAEFFVSLAKNVLLTAKMNEKLRDTTTEVKEMRMKQKFVSKVQKVTDIEEITTNLTENTKELLDYDILSTHIADYKHWRLDGLGIDGRISRPINSRDSNPTMRFMLTRSLAICSSSPQVYSPLIDSSDRVVGILVLKSSKQPKQERNLGASFLRTNLMLKQISNAKVVKELSGLAQHQLAQFSTMVPRRTRAVVESYSKLLSKFVEMDKNLRENHIKSDTLIRFSMNYNDFPPEFNRKFISAISSITGHKPIYNDDILSIDEGNLMSRIFSAGFKCKNLVKMEVSERQSNYVKPTATILYLTHSFDQRVLDDTQIVNVLVDIASDFEVLEFFGCDRKTFCDFIQKVRSFTNNNGFRNWRLSFDHLHFCFFLMHSFNAVSKMTPTEKAALYCHFLCLYSNPFEADDLQVSVKVFALCNLISNLETRKIMSFMDLLTKLDDSDKSEVIGSSNAAVLMAALSRYSYIGRDTERAQKYCEMRFSEELHDEPKEFFNDLMKSIIDVETKVVVFPALAELLRVGFETDPMKKIITDIMNILTK